ncbi:MAG: membrane protein insertion efficiency factor YidD [Candidatus Pacebacteria bacterium]|nr:membrane protein insertion efficiency factor YidD [Candidatus Paceibacterota bacterium]MBP9716157.1 membrane protein insertion efficiency factor YidD [Candidatus Paceibacterota bacterium]
MAKIIIWLIDIYQKTPLKSHYSCKFLPTCSEYSKQAFEKYGFFKGFYLSVWRVLRCHPWQKHSYDPVR